jgi:hypothetical protein
MGLYNEVDFCGLYFEKMETNWKFQKVFERKTEHTSGLCAQNPHSYPRKGGLTCTFMHTSLQILHARRTHHLNATRRNTRSPLQETQQIADSAMS